MFLRSLHKDFLNAAKAETRSADGRGISTEASDRAIEELWEKRLNERRRAFELRGGTHFSILQLVRFRNESKGRAS
jgi:hypothetical protein